VITPNLGDCSRDNARAVMHVPAEFGNPATGFLRGQAYPAESAIGQGLADDEIVKVVCVRNERIGASVALPDAS